MRCGILIVLGCILLSSLVFDTDANSFGSGHYMGSNGSGLVIR